MFQNQRVLRRQINADASSLNKRIYGNAPLERFFDIGGLEIPDKNQGPKNNNLLWRLIPGDFYSACPTRQFHTLPGLLQSAFTAKLLHPVYTDQNYPNRDLDIYLDREILSLVNTSSGSRPYNFNSDITSI